MSHRYSSVIVGLIVVVLAGLALMGALPLNDLLTDYRPIPPYF
jgi:heme A synthase